MRVRVASACITLTFALALAACSNGGSSVSPTPGPPCALPSPLAMVYPIPGATSVPDNPQQFVFATQSTGPLSGYNAYVVWSGTSGFTNASAVQILPAQVPQPAAAPGFANPVYWGVTLAAGFPAQTAVAVYLNVPTAPCSPAGPLGSFTTQ